jgi:predicted porin
MSDLVRSVVASRSVVRVSLLLLLGAFLPQSALAQQPAASQATPQVISCVSKKGERQVCGADASAGVALLRSTGESACLLGKTWGYDNVGVWVFDGCGGEFAIGGANESGASDFVGTVEPYGSLRTHFAGFNDTAEVQDNATRVGIKYQTRGKIKLFAGTEWGVDLVKSSTQFNLSAAGPGDLGVVQTDTSQVFNARLGFVGIDFGPLGRVAIGKQSSTHYDVTSYTTDRFNVFGGQGTSTYVAGTDGGATGTGRADRVVNYRNTIFKIFEVGVQGQFRGTDANGFGTSGQVTILPGVKVGAAYTHSNFPQTTQDLVRDLGGNADYTAVGTRIDWRYLELGFVYAHQSNGDLVQIPIGSQNTPVAFDADGVELYARAGFEKVGFIGGFTYLEPDVKDPLLDPDFKTSYLILGAEYFVARPAKVYTESRIDLSSVSPTGESGNSVFTIGFRYDFSFRVSHK